MGDITAICTACYVAFTGNALNPYGTGRCACGGLLVKPEIDTDVHVHYAAISKAFQNIGCSGHLSRTMH